MNKARVCDLKMNGYMAIQEFKDPIYARNIINYVDFLSTNNSVNSDEFEIPLDETCEDLVIKKNISIDKQKINEMFFSFLETQKENEKLNYKLPTEDVISELNNRDALSKKEKLELLNADFNYNIEKADEHNRRMLSCFEAAREVQNSINFINGKQGRDYGKEIAEAIRETNWDFLLYNPVEGSVVFKNRCDVILRHVNRASGINYNVNCGKYAVKIVIKSFKITMHKTENTIIHNSYIHPHIMRDNYAPCWGNASGAIGKAVTSGDITTILKVIDSLLSNYNPDSPYVTIENYKLSADKQEQRRIKEHKEYEQFDASFGDEEIEEDVEEEDEEDYEDDSDEEDRDVDF